VGKSLIHMVPWIQETIMSADLHFAVPLWRRYHEQEKKRNLQMSGPGLPVDRNSAKLERTR